jgi:hypothetical protein
VLIVHADGRIEIVGPNVFDAVAESGISQPIV